MEISRERNKAPKIPQKAENISKNLRIIYPHYFFFCVLDWLRRVDSNHRSSDHESDEMPTSLLRYRW